MKPNELFTLRDAAATLGVQPYIITYLLLTKRVPEPMRIGNRRHFTVEDLVRISKAMETSSRAGRSRHAE